MVRNYKKKAVDLWARAPLYEALTKIQNGEMKVSAAAQAYRISRTTLYRHINNVRESGGELTIEVLSTFGGRQGLAILTKKEEEVLEATVIAVRETGFIVKNSDIKRVCFEHCASNGIRSTKFSQVTRMASEEWCQRFLKRHPRLILTSESKVKTIRRKKIINRTAKSPLPPKLERQDIYEPDEDYDSDSLNARQIPVLYPAVELINSSIQQDDVIVEFVDNKDEDQDNSNIDGGNESLGQHKDEMRVEEESGAPHVNIDPDLLGVNDVDNDGVVIENTRMKKMKTESEDDA